MSHRGKKIKVKVAHPAIPKGASGRIQEEHHTTTGGVFYGIGFGGGIAYVPAAHVEPDADDVSGQPDVEPDADDMGGNGGQMSVTETLATLDLGRLKSLGTPESTSE